MLSTKYIRLQEQFRNLPDSTKLIILHPAAYSEHRLFGQLLLKEQGGIYVHLPTVAHSIQNIIDAIAVAIRDQTSLKIKSIDSAKQLAKALNELPACLLYLEGYDGDIADLMHDFVLDLATQIKTEHRMILSGRLMPARLLETDRRIISLLPIDTKRMLVDYIHPEEGKAILEVRSFGQGQVLVNGQPILRWEGYLPRALFFFIIDRAMTTRDEIFKMFWPRLSIREATNVFHVTKRKISEILGVNLTTYGAGFYRVSGDVDLHYDVVNFQEAIQNAAVSDEQEAEELYRVAIDLYRDEFLSSITDEWVKRRREEMQLTYTDAIIGLARIYEQRDNLEEALGLFLRAAGVAPTREDLSRAIMNLYHQLGQSALAIETYERLHETLKKSYNVAPDPQTIELMKQIRATLT